MGLTPDEYKQVKSVFDAKGVPEWVWNPIMMSESGGNPNSHALTSKEDSRGLFQINLKAHPQWKNVNLYDPVENAKLAAQNFIAPAYSQALAGAANGNSSLQSKQSITAYVWKNGIRPAWTESKNQSIQKKTTDFLSGKGDTGSVSATQAVGNVVSSLNPSNYVDSLIERFKTFSWNLVPLLVGVILLIAVLYSMFLKSEGSLITGIVGGGKNE